MSIAHEPWIVALSIAVAIQGAYVGLSLAVQVAGAAGVRRRLLLAGAALSLGVAIWSMHFVGMLAVRLPFQVDYLVLPTLLSFLVCVIVVSAGPLTPARLSASAVFMGVGITSMHYIGMWALHASAHMEHAIGFVAAAVAIAIAASGLALYLANLEEGRPPLILSATALGIAISGMHYTAMAGVTIWPHAELVSTAPVLSSDLLAIVVAVVAFAVSGIFLLTLVPESRVPESRVSESRVSGSPAPQPQAAYAPPETATVEAAIEAPAASGGAAAARVEQPALRSAPLATAELHRLSETMRETVRETLGEEADAAESASARLLPVVHDGANRFIAVRDLVAVRANAHYTYLFDGEAQHFCPLSIGEVQSRLDAAHFVRVHRSHIVNLERVVGLKRSGDHGVIELDGDDPYTVPVSRSRYGGVKSQLGLKPREALI
jgi:NO-binding membrane sensor protein with MHYT domain